MLLKDSLSGGLKSVVPDSISQLVSIYACGVTPYSSAHVGHARTYVVFDLLARTLRAQGHMVRLVRNITDIDDKILAAASTQGIGWREVSDMYAEENRVLMRATGLAIPEEPKASDHLEDIFWMIHQLLGLGLAYVATSGDVLYRVSAYGGSTQLMKFREGSLRSEQGVTRVDASGKEDVRDFALWKSVGPTEVGFESPWGWGRPGWHIECSAMIRALFGGSVTIHGGGVDLKFPHHEAEVQQSEPVFGRPLADIWMHNGSVLSDGRKMSKSEGNFVTWQAALDKSEALAPGRGGQLLRFTLLQAHWQKPLDWTDQLLHHANAELVTLTAGLHTPAKSGAAAVSTALIATLDNNLNTPQAVVLLRKLKKEGRTEELSQALTFLGLDVVGWAAATTEAKAVLTLTDAQIADIRQRRERARAQKDWAQSDALRRELQRHGIKELDAPLAK